MPFLPRKTVRRVKGSYGRADLEACDVFNSMKHTFLQRRIFRLIGVSVWVSAFSSLSPLGAHPGHPTFLPRLGREAARPPQEYLETGAPPPLRYLSSSPMVDRGALYYPEEPALEEDPPEAEMEETAPPPASPPPRSLNPSLQVIGSAGDTEEAPPAPPIPSDPSLDDFLLLFKHNVDEEKIALPFQLPGENSSPPPRQSRARYSVAP